MAGHQATSADVAREAGVSRSTVSFVLNGTKGQTIPEPTRQRVLAAAARLQYAPSAEARTLSRGRSDVVLWIRGTRENGIARLQVERLLSAGHRRLGYARPHDERLARASELRLKALRQACAARGLPAPAGDSPAARLAVPPVTMVAVDMRQTARHLAEAVTCLLEGRPVPPGPDWREWETDPDFPGLNAAHQEPRSWNGPANSTRTDPPAAGTARGVGEPIGTGRLDVPSR